MHQCYVYMKTKKKKKKETTLKYFKWRWECKFWLKHICRPVIAQPWLHPMALVGYIMTVMAEEALTFLHAYHIYLSGKCRLPTSSSENWAVDACARTMTADVIWSVHCDLLTLADFFGRGKSADVSQGLQSQTWHLDLKVNSIFFFYSNQYSPKKMQE